MFTHILVPTDGSALSEETVAKAVEYAKKTGARVTFFYAQPDYRFDSYGETVLVNRQAPENLRKQAAARAQEILKKCEATATAAGVAADSVAVPTNAVFEGIIDTAKKTGCDLIFMASHGRRGVSALLLGSETHKVLTHSKVPVLVYR